jgi:hypothetical protein
VACSHHGSPIALSLAIQDAGNVAITGGTIDGGTF